MHKVGGGVHAENVGAVVARVHIEIVGALIVEHVGVGTGVHGIYVGFVIGHGSARTDREIRKLPALQPKAELAVRTVEIELEFRKGSVPLKEVVVIERGDTVVYVQRHVTEALSDDGLLLAEGFVVPVGDLVEVDRGFCFVDLKGVAVFRVGHAEVQAGIALGGERNGRAVVAA